MLVMDFLNFFQNLQVVGFLWPLLEQSSPAHLKSSLWRRKDHKEAQQYFSRGNTSLRNLNNMSEIDILHWLI
jgi:hypothetical protein